MRLLLNIVAIILITGLSAAAATVEYNYQNGQCEGGGPGWWSVTTITNGVPTHITGRDCDGKLYDRDLNRRIVPDDPVTGPPTFTGNCGSAVWKATIVRNANQHPTWMGGRACDGTYWVIDSFAEPGPGKDDDNLQ